MASVHNRQRRSLERDVRQRAQRDAKARQQRIKQEARAARSLLPRKQLDMNSISGRAARAFLTAYTRVEPGQQHLERTLEAALRLLDEQDLACMTSVERGMERARNALRQVLSQKNRSPLHLVQA